MALENMLSETARHIAQKELVTGKEVKRGMNGLWLGAVEEAGRGVSLRIQWYS